MQTQQSTSPSILRILRDLIPTRTVRQHEHRVIAEIQANKLRRHLRVDDSLLTTDIVAGLPNLRLAFDPDLPTSGMSFWNGHQWIILLNPTEVEARQRFTLLHELHHIICHPQNHRLFGSTTARTDPAAERMADYFAACALMPKLYVKRLFGRGVHQPHQLADYFGVSTTAMRYRLEQLGLIPRAHRCNAPHKPHRSHSPGAAIT